MSELNHLDAQGRARIVDVGGKPDTARSARAEGAITMSTDALDAIERNSLAKGDAHNRQQDAVAVADNRRCWRDMHNGQPDSLR